MSAAEGWEHLLDADERILWQGQPGLPESGRAMRVVFPVFGAVFTLVALGILTFFLAGNDLPLGLTLVVLVFILPFLGIGLFLMLFAARFTERLAARTQYTLTNRRAFIGSTLFGTRRLTTLPLRAEHLVLIEGEGGRGTVIFRPRPAKGQGTSLSLGLQSGFLNIPDAAEVHALARKAVEEAR